jgi:hypothetical protein
MSFRRSRSRCIGRGTIGSAVCTIRPWNAAWEWWPPSPSGWLVGSRPARSSSHRDGRAVLRRRVRSPMGAYRGLAAKCPTDGFRESLARSALIGPTTSLKSVGRILSRFLGQGGGWRGSKISSGRQFDATLSPSSKRGSPTGLLGFQLQRRAEHPDAPRRSCRVCCTPRHTWEETAPWRLSLDSKGSHPYIKCDVRVA